MRELQVKIGEHNILFICHSPKIYEQIIRLFPLVSKGFFPNMVIHLFNNYGQPFNGYDVHLIKKNNKILFSRSDYLIETTADYSSSSIYGYDEMAFEHALLHLYSSYIVYHNWGLLIHSSCVLNNECAHIFTGRSGAGKSTIAALSRPRSLMSDEATLVKISSKGITVFDSPFRSDTLSDGKKEPIKLSSIQIIHQATYNKRISVRKADALITLLDKVFYWAHDSQETRRILKLLKELVEVTPVYDLYFQKKPTFWELIS